MPSAPTTSQSNASGKIAITIPSAATLSSRAHRQYISPSTKSTTIALVANGKTTQIAEADLTPTSSGCSATSAGTQCSVSFIAPTGSDTFLMTLYDQTGGKGNVLATANIAATLSAGAVTSVPVSLDGTPTAATVVLGASELPVGTAGSTSVIVQATDADGNIIVGPGSFSSPLALAITGDAHNTLSLSTSSVTAPGQAITLKYNGGSNVGSKITPSGSGLTGTSATFAGSGGTDTLFQYNDPSLIPGGGGYEYFSPEDVAAGPNGTAAAVINGYGYSYTCSCYPFDGMGIAAMTAAAGVQTMFVGDTSDYYNPPTAGSVTVPGMTVVHGMSTTLNTDEFTDAYDDIAVGSTGLIYYSGELSSNSAPNCSGGSELTGTLGVLNPSARTATEYPLKGYPGAIKIDSAGNVWFIESEGSCSTTGSLLGSDDYAIGELKAGSSTPIETPFSTAGLSAIVYPIDMSITPDGSQMFIADEDSNVIAKIATATLSSPSTVTLTHSLDPYAIATADDGTTLWWSDSFSGYEAYYGYVPGTDAFANSSLSEALFPINDFYSYSLTYADGSFWSGQDEEPAGLGRVSVSGASPVTSYYPTPTIDEDGGQEFYSVSAGGGYVWAADDDYENINAFQYGAQSSGTITYTSHRIGSFTAPPSKKPALKTGHHAVNPHPHGTIR